MSDIVFLYVTTPSVAEAKRIATELMNSRLIACANILPQMESIYRWEGEVRNDQEAVLILKTRKSLAKQATAKTCELHPYDTPCVLEIPIQDGAEKYLAWLHSET